MRVEVRIQSADVKDRVLRGKVQSVMSEHGYYGGVVYLFPCNVTSVFTIINITGCVDPSVSINVFITI